MGPWRGFLCQVLVLVTYVWDERWRPLSCLTSVISYLCWPIESTCRYFMTQFNWALKVFIFIYHSSIQYLCIQNGMHYYFFKCKHMEETRKGRAIDPLAKYKSGTSQHCIHKLISCVTHDGMCEVWSSAASSCSLTNVYWSVESSTRFIGGLFKKKKTLIHTIGVLLLWEMVAKENNSVWYHLLFAMLVAMTLFILKK